jgi:hypothetical protein
MPSLRFAAPIVLAFALAAAPTMAQNVPPALGAPSPLQPGDAFGEDVMMPKRTIVYLKGTSQWDGAFDTLVDAFKSLNEYLDKQGIKPAGPVMTIYTQTDDKGFAFEAAVRRHRHRPGAVGQGAQIRPPRVLRCDGFDLRGDHQLPRRQTSRRQGTVHRGIRHRPGEDQRRQSGDQRVRPGEIEVGCGFGHG